MYALGQADTGTSAASGQAAKPARATAGEVLRTGFLFGVGATAAAGLLAALAALFWRVCRGEPKSPWNPGATNGASAVRGARRLRGARRRRRR